MIDEATEGEFELTLWIHSRDGTDEVDSIGFASFSGTIPAVVIEHLYAHANDGMAAFADYPILQLDCWHDCVCHWFSDDGLITLVLDPVTDNEE